MDEIAERLVKVEGRASSNTHRLNGLESLAAAINKQGENLASMVTELKHTNENLTGLATRVGHLEKRPGALWDKLVGGIVGALASGVVVALLALILK